MQKKGRLSANRDNNSAIITDLNFKLAAKDKEIVELNKLGEFYKSKLQSETLNANELSVKLSKTLENNNIIEHQLNETKM